MAGEGMPVQLATRVLGVSESGYYEWRNRPPSAQEVRDAWLIEQIEAVHAVSKGVYGARRVHAELTLGLGHLGGTQCSRDDRSRRGHQRIDVDAKAGAHHGG
jgi:hypothetical protein